MLTGILMLVVSCIPRETPPEEMLILNLINQLPPELAENSGLISHGGLIWYISDSGNDPEIFGYSREQNSVVKTLSVKGVSNIDWEDITQNDQYVFIGDFGNNAGNRTNLKIIRLDKSDLLSATDTIVPNGIITFRYEDQGDFTPSPEATPFDCEAFIATSDSLFLFTKDWVTQQTRIYSLSSAPGDYNATFMDQWDVDGLITSAAWSRESNLMILLGYTPAVPFVIVYNGFDENTRGYVDSKRSEFMNFIGAQTEGIAITENGTIVISSETSLVAGTPARLFILREE